MLIDSEQISNAKHILLITNNRSFANSSALYSYLLTLHKKVSLQNVEALDKNLSFVPWFEKARSVRPSTADYIIEVDDESLALYEFFTTHSIKINQKMATALYAGFYTRYDTFMSEDCDGTIFAVISALLELKADKKRCREFLSYRNSLAFTRLKVRLYNTLLLKESATHAFVSISDEDLKSSGAHLSDAYEILYEFLKIVHVKRVTLLKSDENNKIIKEI